MTDHAIEGHAIEADATHWFSHTVPEAHAKFVATATTAGLDVETVEHPLPGPDGETLHSAVTTFGPDDARNVVLCLSGIHGIEGYFGSAIQCDAIADASDLLRLPADTKIVFIHLVNPWGTAWSGRRERGQRRAAAWQLLLPSRQAGEPRVRRLRRHDGLPLDRVGRGVPRESRSCRRRADTPPARGADGRHGRRPEHPSRRDHLHR